MSRYIKRRMLAAEFAAVRPLLRISDDRIEAARLALVEGMTLAAVGKRYGWTRQAVGNCVNVVWRTLGDWRAAQQAAAEAAETLPPGWERVTLIAPAELAAQLREQVAQAKRER